MKRIILLIILLAVQIYCSVNAQDSSSRSTSFCKSAGQSNASVYLRFADGRFRLHRSDDSTVGRYEALTWKVISFYIGYFTPDGIYREWSQPGQSINENIVKGIRSYQQDDYCVFVRNILLRNLLSGRQMHVPDACLYIPLRNPPDPAKIYRTDRYDPPDTIIIVSSAKKMEQLAVHFERNKIGFYYAWSNNHFGTSYGKGFGRVIWYQLKEESHSPVRDKTSFGSSSFRGITKLITKKYASLL